MNKEDIKILFVDIDWTILDDNKKEFDVYSINVLKQAQSKGIKVCICTARPYESVKNIKLFELFNPDALISCNGSAIFYENKLIRSLEIPPQVVRRICKEAVKHHMNVELNGPIERCVVSKRLKYVKLIYSLFYDCLPEVKKYDNGPVVTMLLVGPQKYDKYITPHLRHGMFFKRFTEIGADISATPIEKGQAVTYLLDYLGIKKEQSISFGDSDLDITMFDATGYSVCVGNANEEIQMHATFIAKPLAESGVGHFIEDNIL